MLIYGIKKLKLAWDLHQKKQVGLWLERFDPEYSPLIPDPSGYRHNGKQKLYLRMLCCATWIWDQSLLTVRVNTITRWVVKELPNWLTENTPSTPRVA